jgi:hypothetical protein
MDRQEFGTGNQEEVFKKILSEGDIVGTESR